MWMFDDAKLPAEDQRKALAFLACQAFLEMRLLGREGKSAQVADLAEAFHNLPLMSWAPEFSMKCQRGFFARYKAKHDIREGFDYVASLDKIVTMES